MTSTTIDTSDLASELQRLAREAHPDLRTSCALISPGDEFELTQAEAAPLARAVTSVRRASGAARKLARRLLSELGAPDHVELIKMPSGAPQWPPGYTGSLAHDDNFAVAVVSPDKKILSVGIDIEPRIPLPVEILSLVATPFELEQLAGDLIDARLLFCMKEAAYKATNPLDGIFMDFHDVEVCLSSKVGRTKSGRCIQLYVTTYPRLIALAVLTRNSAG